jgi:hypothetical protein
MQTDVVLSTTQNSRSEETNLKQVKPTESKQTTRGRPKSRTTSLASQRRVRSVSTRPVKHTSSNQPMENAHQSQRSKGAD